jgi:hypothetical protein
MLSNASLVPYICPPNFLLNFRMLTVIVFSESDSHEFGPSRCQDPGILSNGGIAAPYLTECSHIIDIGRKINLVSIESEL